jgi:hypothetical protein
LNIDASLAQEVGFLLEQELKSTWHPAPSILSGNAWEMQLQ